MDKERARPNYWAVWGWLMGLAIASVLFSLLPLPRPLILAFIFVVAWVKALLVALNFMHLRFERVALSALVLLPLLFFAILTAVLLSDIIPH